MAIATPLHISITVFCGALGILFSPVMLGHGATKGFFNGGGELEGILVKFNLTHGGGPDSIKLGLRRLWAVSNGKSFSLIKSFLIGYLTYILL